jgi:hypothetical protein
LGYRGTHDMCGSFSPDGRVKRAEESGKRQSRELASLKSRLASWRLLPAAAVSIGGCWDALHSGAAAAAISCREGACQSGRSRYLNFLGPDCIRPFDTAQVPFGKGFRSGFDDNGLNPGPDTPTRTASSHCDLVG